MIIEHKLEERIRKKKTFLCVGLDSDLSKIPTQFLNTSNPQFKFNRWIIDQTNEFVCAYKPNLAFYEAQGELGWRALQLTQEYLRTSYPDIVTIADAKRGDIGSTNQGYVEAIFDNLGFDAITLHPYLGQEALQPFLERSDKVNIILVKTSNPGSGEFQDQLVVDSGGTKPLWSVVAKQVVNGWNKNKNCWLVAGATYPKILKQIRSQIGDVPLLIPGIGTQGGDLESVLKVAKNSHGTGVIINSSRGIIFAANPQREAVKLQSLMSANLRS